LKERFDHCWVSAIGLDQASTLQPILQKQQRRNAGDSKRWVNSEWMFGDIFPARTRSDWAFVKDYIWAQRGAGAAQNRVSGHTVWAPGLACRRVFGAEEDVEGSFSGRSADRNAGKDLSGSGKSGNGHGGSVRCWASALVQVADLDLRSGRKV
jgi:hypothetical protein